MKIPTNLKHKPVFLVEDYDKIDGHHAWDSDAKGLTLGLAQWNDRGRVDISGKFGAIPVKSGLVNRKNCPSHEF